MVSQLALRSFLVRVSAAAQSTAARVQASSISMQSSSAQFAPCPKNGTIACAASPTRASVAAAPWCTHGQHRTVTSEPTGLSR